MQEQKTETGIDISTFVADKAAGRATLTKPVKASANYLYIKTNFKVASVNGIPSIVEDAPEIKNINRQSLTDLEAALATQEAVIGNARAQIAAITAEMDALDLK